MNRRPDSRHRPLASWGVVLPVLCALVGALDARDAWARDCDKLSDWRLREFCKKSCDSLPGRTCARCVKVTLHDCKCTPWGCAKCPKNEWYDCNPCPDARAECRSLQEQAFKKLADIERVERETAERLQRKAKEKVDRLAKQAEERKRKAEEQARKAREERDRLAAEAARVAQAAKDEADRLLRKEAEQAARAAAEAEKAAKEAAERLAREVAANLAAVQRRAQGKLKELVDGALGTLTGAAASAKSAVAGAVGARIDSLGPLAESAKRGAQEALQRASSAAAGGAAAFFQAQLTPLAGCFRDTRHLAALVAKLAADAGGAATDAAAQIPGAFAKANEVIDAELSKGASSLTRVRTELERTVDEAKVAATAIVERARRSAQEIIDGPALAAIEGALSGNFPGVGSALAEAVAKINGAISELGSAVSRAAGAARTAIEGSVAAAVKAGEAALARTTKAAESAFKMPAPSGTTLLDGIRKYPDQALALLNCLYATILPKDLAGAVPTEALVPLLRQALAQAKGLGDPGALVQKAMEQAMTGALELAPRAIEHVMGLRQKLRELAVLEYTAPRKQPQPRCPFKGPFQCTEHDDQINDFVTHVFQPLAEPLTALLTKIVPEPVAKLVVAGTDKPMRMVALVTFRTFIAVRTGLMQLARLLVPALLKGLDFAFQKTGVLEPPEQVKELLLAAFDGFMEVFGGTGAALLEVMGLKAPIEGILTSLVAAFDQVKVAMGSVSKMAEARSAAELAKVYEGATGDAPEAVQRRAGEFAARELVAARAAAEAASAEVVAAEKALLEAERRGEGAAAAARKALEAKQRALATASDAALLKARAAERADPNKVKARIIGAVWDQMSEAIMKATWDVTNTAAEFLVSAVNKVSAAASDLQFGVMAAILSAVPVTTDYGPMLINLYGTAIQIEYGVLSALWSMFFALVVPEMRVWIKDQVVAQKVVFIEMAQGQGKTGADGQKTLQGFGQTLIEAVLKASPFMERMARARDLVKLGTAGLLVGPLGKLFEKIPPELWAFLQRAVTKGIDLAKKAVIGAAKAGAGTLVGQKKGESIDLKKIAKAIARALKDPVIEYVVSLLPDDRPGDRPVWATVKPLLEAGLKEGASRLEQKENPLEVLNPIEVLGIIGTALGKKDVVDGLAKLLTADWNLPGLDEAARRGITKAAAALRNLDQAAALLKGGPLGILREAVHLMEPVIRGVLERELPPEPRIRAAFKASLDKAFKLLQEPEAMRAVIGKGALGIVAKVIELSHEPVTELLLRDFPEGSAKEAIRSAVRTLASEAVTADFTQKLTTDGVFAVAGKVVGKAPVAKALAEMLTAGLGNAKLTADIEDAIRTSAAQLGRGTRDLQTRGLRVILASFGKPLASYLTGELCKGLQSPALVAAVGAAVQRALAALAADQNPLDGLRTVPQTLLGGLEAYARKLLERAQTLFAAKADAASAALRGLLGALRARADMGRRLGFARQALAELAAATGGAKLPAPEEVLR